MPLLGLTMNISQHNYQSLKLSLFNKEQALLITLNDPKSGNAFLNQMMSDLVETLILADQSRSIRCIVITGEGKHFCAGGNTKAMRGKTDMFAGQANELRLQYVHGIQRIGQTIESLSTPIVAMINGAAIGAGLDLACMCDLRYASDRAKFGATFAKLGLVPGDGGAYFLQRTIGYPMAMEMILTADVYDSSWAKDAGLIHEAIALEDLSEYVEQIVAKICLNAPMAMNMARRAMVNAYRSDLRSHLDLLASYQAIAQRSDDHFHALDAIEKGCQPDFKGK